MWDEFSLADSGQLMRVMKRPPSSACLRLRSELLGVAPAGEGYEKFDAHWRGLEIGLALSVSDGMPHCRALYLMLTEAGLKSISTRNTVSVSVQAGNGEDV